MLKEFTYDLSEIKNLKIAAASSDINLMSTLESNLKVTVETDKEDYEPWIERHGSFFELKLSKKRTQWGFLNLFDNEDVESAKIFVPSNITSLHIADASGDLEINDLDLEYLKVSSASGDIKIENTASGQLDVNVVSGDIILKATNFNDGAFKSVSGDISVGVLPPDKRNIKISTVSGDAVFTYSDVPSLSLYFSSVSGEVSSRFPINKDGKRYYTEGGTQAEKIHVSSVSGDLVLKVSNSRTAVKEPVKREKEIIIDDKELDEETEKTLRLFEEGKLTEEYTRQILELIGYTKEEIDRLLSLENINNTEKESKGGEQA
ncbi:MAG: DUF4097 family beta strand repeat protein [Kosmotoga sp.]|uniref:DUF4097 family beta strand repeat-containing protein n=1 Tax=Kosmotoga sp. TaxID=1955248 RepID=UPI001D8C7E8D|nr:DUF4097 family beta strand repeat-containing protein [Kosmotoga sp.]MBO8167418.1 DUF4097 family beta strand repeat protein [Kosmotoga sp.]MCD6159559.1 DUF4097 family beta strand repeat protein [Kosmotoga sp.]